MNPRFFCFFYERYTYLYASIQQYLTEIQHVVRVKNFITSFFEYFKTFYIVTAARYTIGKGNIYYLSIYHHNSEV